ncbi:hypothetical protein F5876DRAFT_66348 [Lentinula aff. lateritia]|uniref:Uncharacterized protein n=1 Tax=Lentinula aff. lateritia TaxID=2804960 RepID=A0ACC1TXY5_9AGAR|nr:hypothetical protein F5876DRAFT_66348 [Lentinula aff. lateritia]
MSVINGTVLEVNRPGAYTSHQHNGKAVVDYCVVSNDMLNAVKHMRVYGNPKQVEDRWSDHSMLSISKASAVKEQVKMAIKIQPLHEPTDVLYNKILASALSGEEALKQYYGNFYYANDPVTVYTDGSCLGGGTNFAQAGAGICYGLDSKRNQKRAASTRFVWVKGHSGNQNNDETNNLAKRGATMDLPGNYRPLKEAPWTCNTSCLVPLEGDKVSTALPKDVGGERKAGVDNVRQGEVSHRERSKVAKIQEDNLKKLQNCKNIAHFRSLYINCMDGKAKEMEVTME